MSVRALINRKYFWRYFFAVVIFVIIALYLVAAIFLQATSKITTQHGLAIFFFVINGLLVIGMGIELLGINRTSKWPWYTWFVLLPLIAVIYFVPLSLTEQRYYPYQAIKWGQFQFWFALVVLIGVVLIWWFFWWWHRKLVSAGKMALIGFVVLLVTIAVKGLNNLILNTNNLGWINLMWMLLIVITTDSFAFLTGIAWGKNPAFPKISPHKTWIGFLGGGIIGTLFGVLFGLLTWKLSGNNVTFWIFKLAINNNTARYGITILLSFIISFLAIVSDLLFSAVKRFAKIKDYSRLIPGHGGLMDRLDSEILPLILLYIMALTFATVN